MQLDKTQSTEQQSSTGVPPQEAFSRLLVGLFKENTFQHIREQLSMKSWYHLCSKAEQQCIDCFLNATKDTELPPHRLARNHRRGDIGAWLLMYHLPPHPQLQVIFQQLQSRQPDLLTNPDDRILLGKMIDIHTMIQSQDRQSYIDYILSLPREEQSKTIQTYKQMIIARMSHTNGRSIYFPYLPAEKTIDTYDLESLHDPALQVEYPDYEVNLQRLLDAPDHIQPPRSSLQELFHDILLISTLAHQLQDTSLLQQVIDILADETTGLITRNYPSDLFSPPHVSPQQDKKTPQEEKNIPDNYLQHSYTTLTSMRSSVHALLQDRATLHAIFQSKINDSESVSENIRKNIMLISNLNQRIDIHYFIRHFPSKSDISNSFSSANEGISSNHNISKLTKNTSHLRTEDLVFLSSERQYALMSAAILLGYWKVKGQDKIKINTFSGLNNQDKHILIPILKSAPINYSLIRILDYINILPSTSIHITHSRVLKRIRDNYGFQNAPSAIDENSTYLIPIYKGSYLEDGVCCNPDVRETTREEIRALVYQHIQTYNQQYYQGTNNFQELSSTDFCYRVVDYLRLLRQTDTGYDFLYEQLLNTCSPVQTFTMFFKDQHTIITNTSTDGHVEGDEYR